jgi:hypothetical protein
VWVQLASPAPSFPCREYESRFERGYGYFHSVIQDVVEKNFDFINPMCGFARIRCPKRIVQHRRPHPGFKPRIRRKRERHQYAYQNLPFNIIASLFQFKHAEYFEIVEVLATRPPDVKLDRNSEEY